MLLDLGRILRVCCMDCNRLLRLIVVEPGMGGTSHGLCAACDAKREERENAPPAA